MEITKKKVVEENKIHETCALCKTLTNVKIDSHVDNRTTYVEGAGQLCVDCYEKIYG